MLRRSLYLKLAALLLLVSVLGLGLVAVLSRGLTVNAFERFLLEDMRNALSQELQDYYQRYGSWQGLEQAMTPPPPPVGIPQERLEPSRARPPRRAPQPLAPGAPFPTEPPATPRPYAFVDNQGLVLLPAGRWHSRQRVSPAVLARGTPVYGEGGTTLGFLLLSANRSAIADSLQSFSRNLNRILGLSAAVALVLALGIGMLFARSLVRPIRAMHLATRALAKGSYHPVQVRSQDELGQLAASFNSMMEALARAERNRQQMSADIAHELRTPLTGLAWQLEAMQAGALEPSPEDLGLMQTQVAHLQHLVEDMRLLSLADAGQFRVQPEPHALAKLLQQAYQHHAPLAQAQGIDLLLIDETPPGTTVLLDGARMMQVLHNLLSNALKHSASGSTIRLTARWHDAGLQLSVCDEGSGIAAEQLPYVFERFYRADAARQHDGSASGLGLAIARAIVHAHGGRIWLESRLGHGTQVHLHIPQS